MQTHFPVLIMIARPAAGKSEIIHTLRTISPEDRLERFHIGSIEVLDDFPMLWTWLEEDDLLEKVFKRARLHTTPDGYFLHADLWHLLIRRLNLEYIKWRRDAGNDGTAIIEFARGSEHGGNRTALGHFDTNLLKKAAVLYIDVSYNESLRKNRTRFNPERPDSILEHSLSDEKMERLYQHNDWEQISADDDQYLTIDGVRIPYAIFPNEDDITTAGGEPLEARLETVLSRLWSIYQMTAV